MNYRFFLLIAMAAQQGLSGGASYVDMIQMWRDSREESLKADDGWLSVAGLFWLKEGANRCGSDSASEVVLPEGGPAHGGVFEFHSGVTTWKSDSESRLLKPDSQGKPDTVKIGTVTMYVIERGGRFGIRMKDTQSKYRKEFTRLHWYPVKPGFRVEATWHPYAEHHTMQVPNILGMVEDSPNPGYAEFTINGHQLRLDPVLEGEQLFFIFKDETSGKETYPPGRFLYTELPHDGKVILDFNKAYNPPCAFTPYATCPLPPKQNRLAVKIEAGELTYGTH